MSLASGYLFSSVVFHFSTLCSRAFSSRLSVVSSSHAHQPLNSFHSFDFVSFCSPSFVEGWTLVTALLGGNVLLPIIPHTYIPAHQPAKIYKSQSSSFFFTFFFYVALVFRKLQISSVVFFFPYQPASRYIFHAVCLSLSELLHIIQNVCCMYVRPKFCVIYIQKKTKKKQILCSTYIYNLLYIYLIKTLSERVKKKSC